MIRRVPLIGVLLLMLACGVSVPIVLAAGPVNCSKYYECYDYEEAPTEAWKEEKLVLPAPPDRSKLIPFEVSVANANQFFVDPASISVGKDGIVRYTVVVQASGGATTINYEGLRCETRERRLYAFGEPDGSWIENKGSIWLGMLKQQHKLLNSYSAVLADEYFCIDRIPVESQAQAIERLQKGSAAASARR